MVIALLDQQRLFAESYVLGHGNATQAARAQAHALRGRLASKALGILEKILPTVDPP